MSTKKQLQPNATASIALTPKAHIPAIPRFMVTTEGEDGVHEWFASFGEAKARALEVASSSGLKIIILEVVGEAAPAKAAYTAVTK